MKRKLFSLLVLLVAAVTGAWADATIAKLWVGNSEEVTSEGTITGTGATEGTASVAIENGSMVLTLNNFKFIGCGYNDSGIYYQSNTNGNTPLIIKIEGDNEITLPDVAEKSLYGFYLFGGNGDHVFTITGSGSLTVTVGDGNLSNGIYVQQADLVLAGGTVTANAGSAGAEFKSLGVSVPQGTLTIDGCTLKASGSTTSASRGVNVMKNVTIKSGELEAYGYSKGIKNSDGGDALVFAEGVTPTLFKAGDNEASATDVSKYEGQKYLHVVCTGGAEPAAPTGDGVNYALSVGTSEHGTVTFKVGENTVTTAKEGDVVTVSVEPATGYAVKEASGKWYAAVANSRRIQAESPEIELLSDITLTPDNSLENTWSFTMERANAQISVTYKHRHIWDFSVVDGSTLKAVCQNQSGDCDVPSATVTTEITLPEDIIYGNNNAAAIDLTTFNEALGGEGEAELVSISYKGTLLNGGATYGPTATVPTLPGDYTVTITVKAGDNNYDVSNDFTLEQKAMVGEMIVPIDNCVYNGQFQEPTVVVKDGDKVLTIGTDYLLGFDDNVNAGLGIVMVHGIGNFTGTTYATFNILDKEMTADMIEAIADQSYTGQAIEPAVVVKDGETVLEEGRDYSVTYENNVEVGTATVIVTAWTSGNYRGEIKATFNIVGTTGIGAVSGASKTAAKLYDLGGRKAKATKRSAEGRLYPQGLKKGVVIVDGKKVVVK